MKGISNGGQRENGAAAEQIGQSQLEMDKKKSARNFGGPDQVQKAGGRGEGGGGHANGPRSGAGVKMEWRPSPDGKRA